MSSRRHRRKRQCGRKARYLTREAADYAERRARAAGLEVRAYHCTFCRAYYLGHPIGCVTRRLAAERRKAR